MILFSVKKVYNFFRDQSHSIQYNSIQRIFVIKTESYNRVIRFNPIQSCGSTSDSMVRPVTQYPTESITDLSFKTMQRSKDRAWRKHQTRKDATVVQRTYLVAPPLKEATWWRVVFGCH